MQTYNESGSNNCTYIKTKYSWKRKATSFVIYPGRLVACMHFISKAFLIFFTALKMSWMKKERCSWKTNFCKDSFFPNVKWKQYCGRNTRKKLIQRNHQFLSQENFCLRKYRDMGMCLVKILKDHYFPDKLQIQTVSSFEFQRNWAKTKPWVFDWSFFLATF